MLRECLDIQQIKEEAEELKHATILWLTQIASTPGAYDEKRRAIPLHPSTLR